jgi:hypothetical protein
MKATHAVEVNPPGCMTPSRCNGCLAEPPLFELSFGGAHHTVVSIGRRCAETLKRLLEEELSR